MQEHGSCFRDFPDQCAGCAEYRERCPDSAMPLVSLSGMGMATYPRHYKGVVIKECKLYHKRRVELLE